jgi:hypothetical protein
LKTGSNAWGLGKFFFLETLSKLWASPFNAFLKKKAKMIPNFFQIHEFYSEESVTDTPWPPNMVLVAFSGRNTVGGVHWVNL